MRTDSNPIAENNRCRYTVRLFVAGDAPNSRLAQENLQRFTAEAVERDFRIEVVDVMENPQLAMEHEIYITPALQILEPAPGSIVFGNLSDREALQALFRKKG
jgi:circadian clock protein KaiB